jgi:vanillate O-demethylase monooxygenase subunit
MITAQRRAIDADPGASVLPLGMDSALVQFRRLVDQALQSGTCTNWPPY